ncbi:MAG TPA: nucleotide sugar dehydrogenase, partial [Bacteroidetes bacterium]|nr:nucleotide sugar dehydrogenase [Bacteroidota bacterium]
PLCRLDNTLSSETAKVLENSYRATNIAFMEEWGRYAEELNIDMFKIVESIRKRPTHSNIRQPGFGVGGYCLTKDPLFAKWAATNFFNTNLDFEFCNMAVKTNRKMPLVTLKYAEKILHNLKNKKILVLGISYKQEVGDTRHSPTKIFVEEALTKGAIISCHDSLVSEWDEMKDVTIYNIIPPFESFDLLIFAVPHEEYRRIDFSQKDLKILDANNVLTDKQIKNIKEHNNYLFSIGKGEGK